MLRISADILLSAADMLVLPYSIPIGDTCMPCWQLLQNIDEASQPVCGKFLPDAQELVDAQLAPLNFLDSVCNQLQVQSPREMI